MDTQKPVPDKVLALFTWKGRLQLQPAPRDAGAVLAERLGFTVWDTAAWDI